MSHTKLSDISDTDNPYEVREAGEGRGMGCFATRDIKPGETVMITFSDLHVDDIDSFETKTNGLIELYEKSEESVRQGWDALFAHYETPKIKCYVRALEKQRPDGTYFTPEEVKKWLGVVLKFDSNNFGSDREDVAVLYPEASRFNHSCDPNLDWENSTYTERWVARANRHIATGEELTIAYTPPHEECETRKADLQKDWGFQCDCPKCTEGLDLYTTSLQRARDILYGLDGVRESRRYDHRRNDIQELADRCRIRTTLLKEIVDRTPEGEDHKWRARQYAMA
ncbi:hypothetical protein F4808DRAFT_436196 [Astrocystis sublimbata]|nr:hypothetical protein F4808DRAFT_436196 [Astrocystis sublimbata]